MQVNNISSNDTSFGARLRVKPEDIDHVMSAIDSKVSDFGGLRRIYNAIKSGETGIGSQDVVYIEDFSRYGKKVRSKDCGFIKARIGNTVYGNDIFPQYSFFSLPHFFEKIQRLSKEKYFDGETNLFNRSDELDNQFCIAIKQLFSGTARSNQATPSKRRDYLLDAIYHLLTKA